MTLYVHHGSRLGELADTLAGLLADPLDDPFETEVVAVPTAGVREYLVRRLATRLGVAANIAWHFPARFVEAALGGRPDDPWAIDRLTLAVLAELDAGAVAVRTGGASVRTGGASVRTGGASVRTGGGGARTGGGGAHTARAVDVGIGHGDRGGDGDGGGGGARIARVVDVGIGHGDGGGRGDGGGHGDSDSDGGGVAAGTVEVAAGGGSGAIGDTDRRYRTARRIADRFDHYGVHRPEMLRAWRAGQATDAVPDPGLSGPSGESLLTPLAPSSRWQYELWTRLADRIDAADPGTWLAERIAALRAGTLDPALPRRVAWVGMSAIPPARLAVLEAVAEHRDVHVLIVRPSPAVWARATALPATLTPRRQFTDQERVVHPLARSWAAPATEMAALVNGLTGAIVTDIDRPRTSPPTLLGQIHDDVRADRRPTRVDAVVAGDGSLQVHACHGATRQLEVLRDALAARFSADPTLRPDDVIVLTPDVARFAPWAAAIFGRAVVPLPVTVSDLGLGTATPVAEALGELVRLVSSRCRASEIVALLGRAPVRLRLGLGADDVDQIADWARSLATSWGLTADHRAGWLGDDAEITIGSWRATVDSLLAGALMSAPQPRRTFGGLTPFDDITPAAAVVAGRLADALARLDHARQQLAGERPVAEWCDVLAELLDLLCATEPDDRWQLEAVRGGLARIREAAAENPALVGSDEVLDLLNDALVDERGRLRLGTGRITLTGLVPLRNVPARIVALLGFDDEHLGAGAPDRDDLLAVRPCVGENDPRMERRQAILDAVLAAEDALIITCDGQDRTTNRHRQFAVPLAELLETVAAMDPAAVDGADPQVVVRHPLRAHDRRNFTPGALVGATPFGFDPIALRLAAGPAPASVTLPVSAGPARSGEPRPAGDPVGSAELGGSDALRRTGDPVGSAELGGSDALRPTGDPVGSAELGGSDALRPAGDSVGSEELGGSGALRRTGDSVGSAVPGAWRRGDDPSGSAVPAVPAGQGAVAGSGGVARPGERDGWGLATAVPATATLADLAQSLTRPHLTYLRRGLDVSLPPDPERADEAIPLWLDRLDQVGRGRELVDMLRYAAGNDESDWETLAADVVPRWRAAATLRADIPPGRLADSVLGEVEAEVRAVLGAAERADLGLSPRHFLTIGDVIDIDLPVAATVRSGSGGVVGPTGVAETAGLSGPDRAIAPADVAGSVDDVVPVGVAGSVDDVVPVGVAGSVDDVVPASATGSVDDVVPVGVAGSVDDVVPVGVAGSVDDVVPASATGAAGDTAPADVTGSVDGVVPVGVAGSVDGVVPFGSAGTTVSIDDGGTASNPPVSADVTVQLRDRLAAHRAGDRRWICSLEYAALRDRYLMRAALEVAAAMVATDSVDWAGAVAVRAAGKRKVPGVVVVDPAAHHDDPAACLAAARRLLTVAAAVHVLAGRDRVPLFETASRLLAAGTPLDEDALWGTPYSSGDLASPEARFVWGDTTLSELLDRRPSPTHLAELVWGAYADFVGSEQLPGDSQ